MLHERHSIAKLSAITWDRLRSLGIAIPGGSRFDCYRELFNRGETITPDSPDFPAARQGFIDLQVMAFALRYAQDHPDWSARLKEAVEGPPELEANPSSDSHARDILHELYTAAVLRKAGAFHCFDESPDLHMIHDDTTPWGVACKRLTSPAKLEQSLRRARKQIVQSQLPGVVALDVSVALNQGQEVIGPQYSNEYLGRRVGEAMHGFVDSYITSIRTDWVRTTWVRGIMITYHYLRISEAHDWEFHTFSFAVPLSDTHARRRGEFDSFTQRYFSGAPTAAAPPPTAGLVGRTEAGTYFAEARRKKWKR